MRYVPGWLGKRRLARERRLPEPWSGEQDLPPQHVVLCGFGAVGNALGKALEEFGLPYVVIERDPDIIRRLQIRGTPCLYGDASQHELLTQARAADASLIVVALPEIEPATLAVRRIRSLNPHVRILARAHGETEAEKLAAVGATEIIQPEVEASVTLIRHTLDWFAVPKDRIREYAERYRNSVDPKRPSGGSTQPSAEPNDDRKDDVGAVTN